MLTLLNADANSFFGDFGKNETFYPPIYFSLKYGQLMLEDYTRNCSRFI